MSSETDERPSLNRTPSVLPDGRLHTNEKQPLLSASSLSDIESSDQHLLPLWNPITHGDDEYLAVIAEAERAIRNGVLPVRIAAGSSGSYFVKNQAGVSSMAFRILISDLHRFRKRSEYSNLKMKNRTVAIILNWENGRCTS